MRSNGLSGLLLLTSPFVKTTKQILLGILVTVVLIHILRNIPNGNQCHFWTLPPQPQHLFPLNEEGTYGRPPAAPAPPPPKKERKPKIYAGYAIDSSCDLHAKKMAKVEQQVEREREEQRSRRRRNSFRRNVSASPSRASSRAGSEARESIRDSKSPDPHQHNGGPVRRKSSVGSADGMSSRKSSGG